MTAEQILAWRVSFSLWGGGQHFERRNVERPIFRNFKTVSIKVTKDELFDRFLFEFIFEIVKY